jgi:hypothetical protein
MRIRCGSPLVVDNSSKTDPTVIPAEDCRVLLDYALDEETGEFCDVLEEVGMCDLIRCWRAVSVRTTQGGGGK